MKPACLLALACCAAASAQTPQGATPAPPPAAPFPAPVEPAAGALTHSRTRQFVIHGGDGLIRGTIAMLAEEAKEDLFKTTAAKDDWKVPVVIFLHGNPGDPLPPRSVAMKHIVTDTGHELRVDLHRSRGVDIDLFKHAITAALIFEHDLRKRPAKVLDTPLIVQPWLVEGLREASAWRARLSDRRLYDAVFKHHELFKLDDLFALDNAGYEDLDGASRPAFRVSSGALVMALLAQPQGQEGFRAFLADAPAFEGETPALLRRHFPDLNLSETSLEKWWALQLAQLAAPTLTDVLTVGETETALENALYLNFRNAEGKLQRKPVTAWQELAELSPADRTESVRLAQDSLVRLSYRCFPSARPLIKEYQTVLDGIARNKTKQTDQQLLELKQTRANMAAKAIRARDFLDWYEITCARETSGAFEDYLKVKARLRERPRTRKDKLSAYLDRMDKIFYRKGDEPPPDQEQIQMPGLTGEPADLPLPGAPPLPDDTPIDLPKR